MSEYHTMRFIYPMGSLRTLELEKSFAEQNIPSGVQLVLMGVKSYSWDLIKKGSQIQVSCFAA